MKKGCEYTGYTKRTEFPNKGIVAVTSENGTEYAVVKGALPGQVVRFAVNKTRKKTEGRLLEVVTPSPAELAVPDRAEVGRHLWEIRENMHEIMQKRREICYNTCKAYRDALAGGLPRRKLRDGEAKLSALRASAQGAGRACWKEKQRQYAHRAALMASLDPYRVLARGYAMVAGEDGRVRQADQIEAGQTIRLLTARRRALCLVTDVEDSDESTQDF